MSKIALAIGLAGLLLADGFDDRIICHGDLSTSA